MSVAGMPAASAAVVATSANDASYSRVRAPECRRMYVASSALSRVGTGTTIPPAASTP